MAGNVYNARIARHFSMQDRIYAAGYKLGSHVRMPGAYVVYVISAARFPQTDPCEMDMK